MTTSDDFGISAEVLDATPGGSHAILGGCSSCVAVTVGASYAQHLCLFQHVQDLHFVGVAH